MAITMAITKCSTSVLQAAILAAALLPQGTSAQGPQREYLAAASDGSELQGEVLEPGGEVWFAFRAEAGVGYGIETAGGTLRDTVLELVAADGQTTLAENDDDTRATGRQSSFLEWECPVSAIYFVMGKGYGSLVGTFMLAITDSSTSPSSGGGTTGSTDSPCTIDQLGQACTGFSSPDQPSICGTACEQLGREALRSGMGCNLEPRILAVLTRLVQTCGGGH